MQKHFIIPIGLLSRRNYQYLIKELLPHFNQNEEQVKNFVNDFWPDVIRMNENRIAPEEFISNLIQRANNRYAVSVSILEIMRVWQGMAPNLALTAKDIKEMMAWTKVQSQALSFYSTSNSHDIKQILDEIQKNSPMSVIETDFGYQFTLDNFNVALYLSYKLNVSRENLMAHVLQQISSHQEMCLVVGPEKDNSIPFSVVQEEMKTLRKMDLDAMHATTVPASILEVENFSSGTFSQLFTSIPAIINVQGERTLFTKKPIIFLVSSIGDSDLAAATANQLAIQKQPSIVLPMTPVAGKQLATKNFHSYVTYVSPTYFGINENDKQFKEASEITDVVEKLVSIQPHRICVGVSSYVDEEKALQLTKELADGRVALTIFNEHMFDLDPQHKFNQYKEHFASASKSYIRFVVPTPEAVGSLPSDRTDKIGHLSLDVVSQAPSNSPISEAVFQKLGLEKDQQFVFVSGTTQPIDVDKNFLAILLTELEKHPSMQVRIGIHPGVAEVNSYLAALLDVCLQHPALSGQVKIILNSNIASKLNENMCSRVELSEFILACDVKGPQAAAVATHIAQAVPGALPVMAVKGGKVAFTGKPAHLPTQWFATKESFFSDKSDGKPRELDNSELSPGENTEERFAKLLLK